MPLGPLRALTLDLSLTWHGVDVVVTRPSPDDVPISTRGIWLTTLTEDVPSGPTLQRREPTRTMALSRAIVSSVPRGTLIEAPEKSGDPVQTWRVDTIERLEADHVRVVVMPVPSCDD